jgi:hypothetical protein
VGCSARTPTAANHRAAPIDGKAELVLPSIGDGKRRLASAIRAKQCPRLV